MDTRILKRTVFVTVLIISSISIFANITLFIWIWNIQFSYDVPQFSERQVEIWNNINCKVVSLIPDGYRYYVAEIKEGKNRYVVKVRRLEGLQANHDRFIGSLLLDGTFNIYFDKNYNVLK